MLFMRERGGKKVDLIWIRYLNLFCPSKNPKPEDIKFAVIGYRDRILNHAAFLNERTNVITGISAVLFHKADTISEIIYFVKTTVEHSLRYNNSEFLGGW